MGIPILANLLYSKAASTTSRKLSDVAKDGKYYRHPDSARISYPVVAEKPLGTINKKLNIAIIGGGAAAVCALYELCNLENSKDNIEFTIYERDPKHFLNVPKTRDVRTVGLRAGRVSAAISSDEPAPANIDHAVYEIGAMRFPEIAGLMWHYASVVYGADTEVNPFPNPGVVPTELVHGDMVDRFANTQWLDDNSPTKKIVDIIGKGLVGQAVGDNTSLFPIGGQDPAKISVKLKSETTTDDELKQIDSQWKDFAKANDKFTLEAAVRKVIEASQDELPNIPGLKPPEEKVSFYVELFGSVGFGTGGFRSVFNMSFVETTRLLLWNYANEYMLPVEANVDFIRTIYEKACEKNNRVQVKLARVCDVAHLDSLGENGEVVKVDSLVVFYNVGFDGNEGPDAQTATYDYVILATTPKATSSMISKVGFDNSVGRRVTLGEYGRQLPPEKYVGNVRPALVLSNTTSDVPNSKLFSAVSTTHMVCCSKVFVTIKVADFDSYAPEFLNFGKIKAIVADCGLGSCYVVPSTIVDKKLRNDSKDYYSFLLSYAWEDDSKGQQHNFDKYPLNTNDTKNMISKVITRTFRYVKDPDKGYKLWWFGEALNNCKLDDPMSYDWTTNDSAGAFKLNNVGDYYNNSLLFRYHTHALSPELDNRFFLAGCSYSNLGGWIEGAFMSALNAVSGLIVAANGGAITSLSDEAQKLLKTLDNVVEKENIKV